MAFDLASAYRHPVVKASYDAGQKKLNFKFEYFANPPFKDPEPPELVSLIMFFPEEDECLNKAIKSYLSLEDALLVDAKSTKTSFQRLLPYTFLKCDSSEESA
jgi:hypothetical protein